CHLAMGRPAEAGPYVEQARKIYPTEPQAVHLAGMINLRLQRFAEAQQNFARYAQMLPGNPYTTFLSGVAFEGTGEKEAAARRFLEYLRSGAQGSEAVYATQRLREWGYLPASGTTPSMPPATAR
ncbi:MAG: peptidase M48 Ste24p, partial [Kiritimatiellae bacterium]|nr:peptidase M48 Ste24p [Kiritimatiellia bacterium]